MRPAIVVSVLALGCGRIDFDAIAGDAGLDAAGCRAPVCADPTFASGGSVTVDAGGSNSTFGTQAIAIAPDGGIVAVGKAGPDGATDLLLFALTAEGTLDTTFGIGGGLVIEDAGRPDDEAIGVTFDPATSDILVVGLSDAHGLVARFTRTGQIRKSFGSEGIVRVDAGETDRGVFNGIAVDPQGRIVVAGQARFATGQFNFTVARLTSAGALDPAFDGDGIVNADLGGARDELGTLGNLTGDRALVVGSSYRGATGFDATLVALGPDGQPIPGFGTAGVAYHDVADVDRYRTITIDAAQRIVAVGVSDQDLLVARHLSNGAVDPTFGTGGATVIPVGGDESLHGVVELADGRIVAVGRTTIEGASRALLVVLSSDGVLLGEHQLANATGLDYAVLDDAGRVLVVGDAAGTVAGTDDLFIARFVIP